MLSIFEMFDEMKLLKIVPKAAISVRKNRVADTRPSEKINSSFFFKLSSIILLVRTLLQKTMVIGFDKVKIKP